VIVFSTEIERQIDVVLTTISDHTDQYSLTFSEDIGSGIFDGFLTRFDAMDSEPEYPALSLSRTPRPKTVSDRMRVLLMLAAWAGSIALVAIFVAYVIARGKLSKERRGRHQPSAGPGLAPNAAVLPGEAGDYSGEYSGDDGTLVDDAPLPINPNPYETVV
jgi:hypothetical protein